MGEFTEKDLRHFRRVAFVAVALSTVTMLACVVLLPLSYQYIQQIHSSMTHDVEFCRVCLNLSGDSGTSKFYKCYFRVAIVIYGLKLLQFNWVKDKKNELKDSVVPPLVIAMVAGCLDISSKLMLLIDSKFTPFSSPT